MTMKQLGAKRLGVKQLGIAGLATVFAGGIVWAVSFDEQPGSALNSSAEVDSTAELYANQVLAAQSESTILHGTGSGSGGGAATATELSNADLPPNARPGECYARVLLPAEYNTVAKQVVKRDAAENIEVIPARYETVQERVLVKEESQKLEIVPAKYEWVEEQVLVKEASEELITEPAEYETIQEQVLVKSAYTVWKKGRGPIERVDNSTGEIMCLVEVPAEYKTVTKRVLAKPAVSRKVSIPAEYATIKKQVVVEPPTTRAVTIPAEYKTIKVTKMVQPAQEKRVAIPAEYDTVSERIKVADSQLVWRPILCETNTTPDVVESLQRALKRAGYDPGPIDGVIGRKTRQALADYQRQHGLAEGSMTLEALGRLGVKLSAL